MSVDKQAIDKAKALTTRILEGEVTPDSHPEVFDDDMVYIQVGIVEQNDMSWLRDKIQSDEFSKEARLNVVLQMSGPKRAELLKGLGGIRLKS